MENLFSVAKSVSIYDIYEAYTGNKLSKFRKKGNVMCPFHGHDNKPSMHLYEDTNSFYCFTCGESGSVIDFVQKIKGYSSPEDAAKDLFTL